MNEKLIAVGYIRVSTDDQASSGLGLESQRAKIVAQCEVSDFHLMTVVEDAGKSAKDMRRPGIQTVMEMVRSGTVQAVVILKLDRLTRSIRDLAFIVEEFAKANVALVAVQDSINTQTAAGRMVVNVLGVIAQWEREAIAERTAAALAVKRSRGEKTGGTVPYGYTSKRGKLVLNEVEQANIQMIRGLREAGSSFREIAKALETRGIRTKTGKVRWSPEAIRGICSGTAGRV